jgi:hypothetical protein
VALELFHSGNPPLANVAPLGKVKVMVVPDLLIKVKMSPELMDTEVLDRDKL